MRRLSLAVGLALPFACATGRIGGRSSASVEIVTADVTHLGSEGADAQLTLRVNNGRLALSVYEADVSIDLQGQRVAEALIALDREVLPGAAEALQIRVPISLRSIPAELGDRLTRGEAVELVVHGVLKAREAGRLSVLPFEALRSVHPAEGEGPAEAR